MAPPRIEDYYSWAGAAQLVHDWLAQHEVELIPRQPGASRIESAVCSIQPAAFDSDGVTDDAIGIGRAQYFHRSKGWGGSLFIYLFHKDGSRAIQTVLLDGDWVQLNRGDFELHKAFRGRDADDVLTCAYGDNQNIPIANFDGTKEGPEIRIEPGIRWLLDSCGNPRHVPEGFVCRAIVHNVLEVFGTATPPASPHPAAGGR